MQVTEIVQTPILQAADRSRQLSVNVIHAIVDIDNPTASALTADLT